MQLSYLSCSYGSAQHLNIQWESLAGKYGWREKLPAAVIFVGFCGYNRRLFQQGMDYNYESVRVCSEGRVLTLIVDTGNHQMVLHTALNSLLFSSACQCLQVSTLQVR